MDAELKAKIEGLLELTAENNAMLKDMKKAQKMAQMMVAVKWVLILAIAFGGYVFVKPYVDNVRELYSSAMQIVGQTK